MGEHEGRFLRGQESVLIMGKRAGNALAGGSKTPKKQQAAAAASADAAAAGASSWKERMMAAMMSEAQSSLNCVELKRLKGFTVWALGSEGL